MSATTPNSERLQEVESPTSAFSFEDRLRGAKKAIQEATNASLRYVETHPISLDEVMRNNNNDSDDDAISEEFDIAMAVFGNDTIAAEEQINSKLTNIEKQISDYLSSHQPSGGESALYSTNQTVDIDCSVLGNQDGESDDFKNALRNEAVELKSKIFFLQRCSEARVALDEAESLSIDASCGNKRAALVDIAKCVCAANEAVKEAEQMVHSQASDARHAHEMEVANQILEATRIQIQRWVIDLDAKVSTILESCITISSKHLTVCHGVVDGISSLKESTEKTSSDDMSATYEGLKVAFEVLTILSDSFGPSKLNNSLYCIADDIKSKVISPIIQEIRTHLESGSFPPCLEMKESSSNESIGIDKHTTISSKRLRKKFYTLEWSHQEEGQQKSSKLIDITWWSNLLISLQSILTFVHDRILLGQAHLSRIVGCSIFGDVLKLSHSPNNLSMLENDFGSTHVGTVMKALTELIWDECIPSTISENVLSKLPDMANFVQESAKKFEQSLTEQNFIPDKNHLSTCANSFMITFSQKIRTTILNEGRDLLLQSDYHKTIRVGVNVNDKKKCNRPSYWEDINVEKDDMSVFLLHECAISTVASDLMNLCIKTMDTAVTIDFKCHKDLERLLPHMLYRSAHELLDVYRGVIPSMYGNEIATIPRTAAILHNDFVFFAHQMLGLGLKYKERFPVVNGDHESPIKCTFVDLVPIFRELAERTMSDMIKYQMHQLSEIVKPRITYIREALRSNEGVVEWTDAETAIEAGIYHLRHLSKSWQTTLSYDVYGRTMGNLVDTLFSFYLDEVLKVQDMSEPACHFVGSLFRNAIRGSVDLFDMNQNPVEAQKEAARYCNVWNKFIAVGKFMNMSIAEINMALSEGTFRFCTGQELSRLVTAVYADSDKRRTLLRLLANH